MKKLKMTAQKLTFEEGCNKYLEYCQQRNLRDGTIAVYKTSINFLIDGYLGKRDFYHINLLICYA